MTARIVWKGLAVVDGEGRVVTWRGSETPKLFHSDEQAQHHRVDGCTLQPVLLIHGSNAAAPEHTRHTADHDAPVLSVTAIRDAKAVMSAAYVPSVGWPATPAAGQRLPMPRHVVETAPPVRTKAPRQYKPKPCAGCKTTFKPSGPRSLYCGKCP